MSLFGSLFAGVSALGAQSQSMAMISNNIANVNTVGYKRDVANFATLVTQADRNAAYSPGGVRASSKGTISQQGILQSSATGTHVAIAGNGFFVVQNSPTAAQQEPLYSRVGSFEEDQQGYLRNANGYYLMGWRLDANGNLPAGSADVNSLEAVDVSFAGGISTPTTGASVTLNLDAEQDATAAGPHFSRAITVYDSLGAAQSLELQFTKTAANDWTLEAFNGATSLGTTAITFNGDGTIATPAPGADGQVTIGLTGINWGNGSNAQDIDINITNVGQLASDYSVSFVGQDGAELGLRSGVSIDADGFVLANFTNGQTRRIFKLPVATFANPNGLVARTGNVYAQTQDSGGYNLREAGDSGAGQLAASALEASNVDLADEFSKMIITQRAYSAGTKVITTADQMLDELLRTR